MAIKLSNITDGRVECLLCPHNCRIEKGKCGICGVRCNSDGEIELTTYGIISGFALDPIEKKPLYHYFPGSRILSIGSFGCNMKCDFCQNYHISQALPGRSDERVSPVSVAARVKNTPGNTGIAFTYNEPVIWFEYVRDVAVLVKNDGFHTVMVSNGFVSEQPLREYLNFIDAFNIDLKSFNDGFYRKVTGASLEPVKTALRMIAAAGNHLEITTLLVPGLNDSEAEMTEIVRWISGELGRAVPFHISRYYPMYKRKDSATAEEKLLTFYDIAHELLDYVYIGNAGTERGHDTMCPECNTLITRRSGYSVSHVKTENGKCGSCGRLIYASFISSSSSRQS